MSAGLRFLRYLSFYFVFMLIQFLHSKAFIYSDAKGTAIEAVLFTDSFSQFREPHNLLYFSDESLTIRCQLRNRSWDTLSSRNALVKHYSDQGMSPTVTFMTLDCSKSYEIEGLVQDESVYWTVNISKREIIDYCHGQSNGKIPWTFKLELEKDLGLFESWGTVVFPDQEPLLSVQLGEILNESIDISAPENVIFWQHPCSPGVAVLVPLSGNKQPLTGCYIVVTHGSFTSNTTRWHDLLHRSSGQPDQHSICKEASFAICEQLSILDLTVVDTYILLVTTKGLIRSESIVEAAKRTNETKLKFQQLTNIHPTLDQAFKAGIAKPERITLHHTSQCDGRELWTREHVSHLIYMIYTYIRNGEEISILLFSEPPFEKWTLFALPDSLKDLLLLSVACDIQRNTVVLLMKEPHEDRSMVAVLDVQASQLSQPVYRFPKHATFTRITFHAQTHVIFVYGSQAWLSLDGGNSFNPVLDIRLSGDSISSLYTDNLGDAFVLVTNLGAVYSGRSDKPRVSEIEPPSKNSGCSFKIASFQHQTSVNIICVQNKSNTLDFTTYTIDLDSRIEEDKIFLFRPLLVTFASERQVTFVVFCGDEFFTDQIGCSETFHPHDVGRVLKTRNGGSAIITEVEQSSIETDFSARVNGLIITPIRFVSKSESPAVQYTLEVNITGFYAYLQLHNLLNDSGWLGEDIGKTVYLSSEISFILVTCNSTSFAIGRLPETRNSSETYIGIFEEGTWFLMDFRPFQAIRPLGSSSLRVFRTSNDSDMAEVTSGANQFAFSSEMIGRVLKHQHGWGLITSVNSPSVAVITSDNIIPGNYTDNWGIYTITINNDSNILYIPRPQLQGWWLAEDECRHFFVGEPPSRLNLFHLDSNEKLSFTLRAISKGITDENPTHPLLRMYIGKTPLLYVESDYRIHSSNHTLHMTITKMPFISGISSISVRLHQTASLLCKESFYIIRGGCPPTKKLRFLYPMSFSLDEFLYGEATDSKGIVRNLRLPYNYRAPSPRGKAIPMSENTYHVDPQKQLYKTTYAVTLNTLRYKQCNGKSYRSECGCTEEMRGSSLVHYSDCIDSAYRMLFSETLTPRFVILQEGREAQPLNFPFYLEELNQRKDFMIHPPNDLTFPDVSSTVLKQDLNSSIQFEGSGLYHFRAYVVQENYTFCSLTDEFIVFIVDTPLPFPVNNVVRACTAMGFASLLLLVYMRNVHGKKKMKND